MVPAKLVLFQEQNGRWATVTEMPADYARVVRSME